MPQTMTKNALLALVLAVPSISPAAEIVRNTVFPFRVSIEGRIVKGDADKLLTVIRTQKRDSLPLTQIELDSPGGDVAEAIKIAETIKDLYLETRVKSAKSCASACVFIWLVGVPRQAMALETIRRAKERSKGMAASMAATLAASLNGTLGLHRPYQANISDIRNSQHQLMKQVQSYLEQQMMPRRLVDEMMSRASNDIYWLNQKDFEVIGEYRPDVEELLIAQCGYIRITESAFDRGVSMDEISKGNTCSWAYLDQLRAKVWAAFKP